MFRVAYDHVDSNLCKLGTLILYMTLTDPKGALEMRPSPSNFFHFHAVFLQTNLPNDRLAPPPLGLVSRHLGNPGFATGSLPADYILAL